MRTKIQPVAIACSDLHLSLNRPACREDEDWMEVQARYLKQIEILRGWETMGPKLPVFCAGDIFDRWNAPPELINFALKYLPDGMYCVPGQHDLPNHRIDQMERSGYGVLVEAEKIKDLSHGTTIPIGPPFTRLALYGFPWGEEVKPLTDEEDNPNANKVFIHIAVIHAYCWMKDRSYPGAPATSNVSSFRKRLTGYDVAVFGDNHKGFLTGENPVILNCGGFICRKSDEIEYKPSVGIIYSDGSVKRHLLDTSKDRFAESIDFKEEETPLDMKEFIEELKGLGEHGLNFRQAVENHLRKDTISKETKEIILQVLENEEV